MVAFTTAEQLTSADTDGALDIYTFGAVSHTSPAPQTPPRLAARRARRRQKNDGTIEVTLTCSEACIATPSGTLTVPVVHRPRKKKFTAARAQRSPSAPAAKATLRLKVPKKAKKAAAAVLKAGKKVKATVTIAVRDAAGNRGRADPHGQAEEVALRPA